jgi:hypothetical protein
MGLAYVIARRGLYLFIIERVGINLQDHLLTSMPFIWRL